MMYDIHMSEPDNSSQEYRDSLAKELIKIRATGDRAGAKDLLENEKSTHTYQLSKLLRREDKEKPRFFKRELDENIKEESQSHNTVSNEPSLYETFPYIQHIQGAGLGVGLDQMFDIATNTGLEEVYIVDVLPSVSLSTKTLLEIGRRHHELFQNYPTTDEYLKYFQSDQIPLTLEMLQGQFDGEEIKIIEETLRQKVKSSRGEQSSDEAPLQMETYLKFKSSQEDYRSWVSDDEALKKIIHMYEEGKLQPVLGDLTGSNSMEQIATRLTTSETPLSLVYLSNAQYYIEKFGQQKNLQSNLDKMPINDNTVLIETNFGNMPIPESVSTDPWVSKMMQSWDYTVQTVEDLQRQKNGEFKIIYNGEEYELHDIFDRQYALQEGATSEEMSIKIPKDGLKIAGL